MSLVLIFLHTEVKKQPSTHTLGNGKGWRKRFKQLHCLFPLPVTLELTHLCPNPEQSGSHLKETYLFGVFLLWGCFWGFGWFAGWWGRLSWFAWVFLFWGFVCFSCGLGFFFLWFLVGWVGFFWFFFWFLVGCGFWGVFLFVFLGGFWFCFFFLNTNASFQAYG